MDMTPDELEAHIKELNIAIDDRAKFNKAVIERLSGEIGTAFLCGIKEGRERSMKIAEEHDNKEIAEAIYMSN